MRIILNKHICAILLTLTMIVTSIIFYPQEASAAKHAYEYRENTGISGTSSYYVSRAKNVSDLHQFPYMDEGLAYAYIKGSKLYIVTPSKEIAVKKLYPILGDVIADNDGNFYVIWGKNNLTQNATVKTVYITKYNSKGKKIKSTGFVGQSTPWHDSDSAKTASPFDYGNCVSVIHDNILICYHAKKRYDGHQCDQVVAVDINTMQPYELPNNTYSGHSFAQDVIYSDKAEDFIFASLCDSSSRGFRINSPSSKYGVDKEVTFHFYLPANVGNDMSILNQTFAQLGGITQTYDGNVVLAGASAKALSSKAKTQHQNLFIQIINPSETTVSKKMFVGGKTRIGKTALSKYDLKTTSVTDYGVMWLTNYTDKDVIMPQVVTAGKKIVIMWNEVNNYQVESYYMVLSSKGKVIKSKTSLGGSCLNSTEKPVYHNKRVKWAYADNGTVRVKSIKL